MLPTLSWHWIRDHAFHVSTENCPSSTIIVNEGYCTISHGWGGILKFPQGIIAKWMQIFSVGIWTKVQGSYFLCHKLLFHHTPNTIIAIITFCGLNSIALSLREHCTLAIVQYSCPQVSLENQNPISSRYLMWLRLFMPEDKVQKLLLAIFNGKRKEKKQNCLQRQ